MKKNVCAVAVLALMPLFTEAAPLSPALQETMKKVSACRDPLNKRRARFAEIADALEELRKQPEIATNAVCAAFVDQQIVNSCRTPGWQGIKRWDVALEHRIPAIARRNIDNPELETSQRVTFAVLLSEYLCGEKRFDEAEAELRKLASLPAKSLRPADLARLDLALADVFRWQDRFAESWDRVEAAAKVLPGDAAKKAFVLADADGNEERAEAVARQIKSMTHRLDIYLELKRFNETTRKLAFDFVTNTTNRLDARGLVAVRWFAEDYAPMGEKALTSLVGADFSKANLSRHLNSAIDSVYTRGDWRRICLLFSAFKGMKCLEAPGQQRKLIVSTAAGGDLATAAALAEANAAREGLAALDKAKFLVSKALLTGGDAEKVIVDSRLERKDEIVLVRTAARQALVWNMTEAAERLSARHSSYFVDFAQRELAVGFSKKPILSISDWRAIAGTLDRQVCDRPFGANLDNLYTDVATGRKAVTPTSGDAKDVTVEVSSVCDTKGLHVFIRVQDPNARKVEAGFADGVGAEMYFAPGKYEPYVCLCSSPREGVTSEFQTAYPNDGHRRVDVMGKKNRDSFRSEVDFTDEDYVLHLYFAWENFYQKLPVAGSKWRFECIAFGPGKPQTLGGSEGVHNSSKWCDLAFGLKPEELTAIRRAAICRAVRSWRMNGKMDRFGTWKDAEIGDPEFYEKVLKPIEADLAAKAKLVTPEMTDETVERLYREAYPRWLGIAHEIDALRSRWLQERMSE